MNDQELFDALLSYRPTPGQFVALVSEKWDWVPVFGVTQENGSVWLKGYTKDGDVLCLPVDQSGVYLPMPGFREGSAIVEALRQRLADFRRRLSEELYPGPKSLSELRTRLKPAHDRLFEHALRALIAYDFLRCDARKKEPRFSLSYNARDSVGRERHGLSLSSRIASIHDQLGHLAHHQATIGAYREMVFRSFLAELLPKRFHVATGFVLGNHYSPKNQLDVIIYDQVDFSPRFRDGDLVVVDLEAVQAIVEVKSTLTSRNLREALSLIDNATRREFPIPPIFKGIFAFGTKIKNFSVVRDSVIAYYNGPEGDEPHPLDLRLLHYNHQVDAIGVLGTYVVVAKPSPRTKQVLVGGFARPLDESGDPATSRFLAELVTYLTIPSGAKRRLLESLRTSRHEPKQWIPVHDQAWRPSLSRGKGTETDKYAEMVERWRSGTGGFPRL